VAKQTNEIVGHDDKGFTKFGHPKVSGIELASREIVLDFFDPVFRIAPAFVQIIDGFVRQSK
jgi:hypothetical protein